MTIHKDEANPFFGGQLERSPKTVGVIVGRFQTPYLHEGHRSLIESVMARHEEVLILLGCTPAQLTNENPLDPDTRRAMILAAYPTVRVNYIWDTPSDELWSKLLDELIDAKYPAHEPVLYGNRDSFIFSYKGVYEYRKLPETVVTSATELRDAVVEPLANEDFRKGMIYAARLRRPVSFQTVDIALIDQNRILLGRKNRDDGLYRFPGGFVDPTDASLAAAAKRELTEEVGSIETHDFKFAGSMRINDFRYPTGSADSILTALFTAKYLWGAPSAADDLDEVVWASLSPATLSGLLVPEHRQLLPMLWASLKG